MSLQDGRRRTNDGSYGEISKYILAMDFGTLVRSRDGAERIAGREGKGSARARARVFNHGSITTDST
jgi:hypothetical protein